MFEADLTGSGLPKSRNRGIWAEDTAGNLQLIVRRGDLITLPDGSSVTLLGVNWDPQFSVGPLGHIGFMSDLNTGQRGVFVSNLVAVPEPSLLVLGWTGVLALAVFWRGPRRYKL